MQHNWIRVVGFVASLGIVGMLSGCASWTTSSLGEERMAESPTLPEVLTEEWVEEAPIMTSSAPPEMEVEPEESSIILTSTEPAIVAAVEPPIEPPADLIHEEDLLTTGPFLLDIPFNFDRAGLREDALMFLEVNAIRLKDEQVSAVLLEGRGDEVGTAYYNLILGERRARAVKQYLHDLGLEASRVLTTSYGTERPLCREHNIECWQLNRSVRFVVQE